MRALRVVIGGLVVTVAAGSPLVASATGAGAPDSGVAGLVRGAPTPGREASATILARDRATGRVVARTHARSGRFRLRLEPGRYVLDASSPGVRAHARRAVRVRAHRFELVLLRLDTPLRDPVPRPLS